MKPITTTLLKIENEFTSNELIQIIELASHKLNLKTVSRYAKDNNMSYNGVKHWRNKITIGSVNFVCDGINKNNIPF